MLDPALLHESLPGGLPWGAQQSPGREPGRAPARTGSYQAAPLAVPAGTAAVAVGADSSGLPREVSAALRGAAGGPGPHGSVKLHRKAVSEHLPVCKFRCDVSFPLETSSACYSIVLLLSERRR